MMPARARASLIARCLSRRGVQTFTFQDNIPASAFVENEGNRVVICNQHHDDFELEAPWLWSNDAKWVHPTSGQRLKTPADYPGSKIQNVRLLMPGGDASAAGLIKPAPPRHSCHSTGGIYKSKNEASGEQDDLVLEVEWQDSSEPSYYHVNWLLERALPKANSQITNANALRRDDELPHVEYRALETDEMALLDLYSALFQHGAVIVRNCPPVFDNEETTPSAVIGNLLAGSLSHGALYGDVFHVEAMPDAHNLAYTAVGLPPHQDLSYYESPPGLQLLHCAEHRNVVGGESLLVDGLAAAHQLKEFAPDLFEILTTTSATFCKQREGADMVAYWPHIQLNTREEIVGINWSPPFEGPLRPNAMNAVAHEDYYTAYTAFARLVDRDRTEHHHALSPQLCRSLKEYAEEHTFEKLLEEGDMLVFNNRRMLHGRKPFEMINGEGARHLVGTYTNMEETLNRYRVLMRKHGWRDGMLNAGNGTEA
jgi:alpha-ketoglutarate-dependent taurine dioxygenase